VLTGGALFLPLWLAVTVLFAWSSSVISDTLSQEGVVE